MRVGSKTGMGGTRPAMTWTTVDHDEDWIKAFSAMAALISLPSWPASCSLVSAIHDFRSASKTWLAGTSPAMTLKGLVQRTGKRYSQRCAARWLCFLGAGLALSFFRALEQKNPRGRGTPGSRRTHGPRHLAAPGRPGGEPDLRCRDE